MCPLGHMSPRVCVPWGMCPLEGVSPRVCVSSGGGVPSGACPLGCMFPKAHPPKMHLPWRRCTPREIHPRGHTWVLRWHKLLSCILRFCWQGLARARSSSHLGRRDEKTLGKQELAPTVYVGSGEVWHKKDCKEEIDLWTNT